MSQNDLKGWTVSVSDDGQYLYATHKDKPGSIQIKAEDEGFVADILDKTGESSASTYATYPELTGEA
jgi:hypothetical protein